MSHGKSILPHPSLNFYNSFHLSPSGLPNLLNSKFDPELYDWPIPDSPSVYVCGCSFTVDHAMICQRGGLVIQRHNEIRDVEAELLDMVCYDVAI